MTDLKILSIRDLLPISGVEYANDISPLSVIITGEKLNETSRVLINDLESPEYMVLSSNQIIAQVPDSERNSILRKVAVLAETPSPKRSSILRFEISNSPKSIKGLEKLVQFFCKILLQTPGSDRFRPTLGGGLLSMVGDNISRQDGKALQTHIVSAVSRTQDQIISLQSPNSRIPSDERLLSATTEAVGFDPLNTAIIARINLSAVSRREAVANLTF